MRIHRKTLHHWNTLKSLNGVLGKLPTMQEIKRNHIPKILLSAFIYSNTPFPFTILFPQTPNKQPFIGTMQTQRNNIFKNQNCKGRILQPRNNRTYGKGKTNEEKNQNPQASIQFQASNPTKNLQQSPKVIEKPTPSNA